jgi:hypothetical protein
MGGQLWTLVESMNVLYMWKKADFKLVNNNVSHFQVSIFIKMGLYGSNLLAPPSNLKMEAVYSSNMEVSPSNL